MLGQRNRFAGEGVDYPYVEDLMLYEAINRFVWKILPHSFEVRLPSLLVKK
jgi:hypothetical protein